MTLKPHSRNYAVIALLLSGALLVGAWIFQYGFGYAPCQMCYWQRHAHKAVIGVSVLVLIWQMTKGQSFKLGNILIILAFLVSAGLALWHVGVEQGIFEELATCLVEDVDMDAIGNTDLLGSLEKKIKPPACSDVAWSLFGISMAGYNALASLFGAAIGVVASARKSA